MIAEVQKDGEITVVHLRGHLDFETSESFKKNLLSRFAGDEKVLFNFQHLSFVGSSGITIFFDALRDFAEKSRNKPKFCGMGSEFRRLFAASPLATLEIYEDESHALVAFRIPSAEKFLANSGPTAFQAEPAWIEGAVTPRVVAEEP